jgi:Wzt C-terminal domain
MIGKPDAVARRYNALNFGSTVHQRPADLPSEATLSRVSILDGWFEDRDGARVAALASNEPCRACMEVRFNENLDDPIFGFTLRNEVAHTVFATTTDHGHGATGGFSRGQVTIVRLSFENCLTPSRYTLTPSVARHGTGADALDLREDIASVVIHGGHFTGGVVNLPHAFEIATR